MTSNLGFDRDSFSVTRELYGPSSKPQRPGMTVRDSTASSIVSSRTNGGDRHEVVSLLTLVRHFLLSTTPYIV